MSLKIRLQNFRCHKIINFELKKGINFVYGPNGSGKTTLLEAISLLSIGKGIKNTASSNIIQHGSMFLSANFSFDDNNIALEKSFSDKNFISKWNGAKIAKVDIANLFGIVWLTPQIVFNFWRESQVRRNFIDRMTYSLLSSHANSCILYEKSKLLRADAVHNNIRDQALYKIYEKSIVEYGLEIMKNRAFLVKKLNLILPEFQFSRQYELSLKDKEFSELLWLADLAKNRHTSHIDYGPHRTEVGVLCDGFHGSYSSTGEQCIAIISLILAMFSIIAQDAKILLLDDVFANLDSNNIDILIDLLRKYAPDAYILISHTNYKAIDACNYIAI